MKSKVFDFIEKFYKISSLSLPSAWVDIYIYIHSPKMRNLIHIRYKKNVNVSVL
jgi:hypothetical protein